MEDEKIHLRECIEYLWKDVGCHIKADYYKEVEKQFTSQQLKASNVRTSLFEIFDYSKRHTVMRAWSDKGDLYRRQCFGSVSPGSFNIAFEKNAVSYGSIDDQILHHISHVVDGTTTGMGSCTLIKSVAPTIVIDLNRKYLIYKVVIYNPREKGTNLLKKKYNNNFLFFFKRTNSTCNT